MYCTHYQGLLAATALTLLTPHFLASDYDAYAASGLLAAVVILLALLTNCHVTSIMPACKGGYIFLHSEHSLACCLDSHYSNWLTTSLRCQLQSSTLSCFVGTSSPCSRPCTQGSPDSGLLTVHSLFQTVCKSAQPRPCTHGYVLQPSPLCSP